MPGLTLHGPLPAEALWLLLREAAAGLAAVHELDMVHRDLKPSNVMLTLDGLTLIGLTLIDFGVARAAEQSQLTRTGLVVGTPAGSGIGQDQNGDGGGSGDNSGESGGGGGGGSSSGRFQLVNAESGNCLAAEYGDSPYDGACSGEGATWSYQSLSGGAFRIVNKRTEGCLYTQTIGHPVFSFICGNSAGQEWRSGSGGTIENLTTGGCLTLADLSGANPTTEPCDGSAAQRWTRS